MKPRLLDLFCGAGGAAMGYHRAGFKVEGIDIEPQPNYPFPFMQADALDYLREIEPGDYEAIHASPPCQAYSTLNAYNGKKYPELIDVVRGLLVDTNLPWVIENVEGAPLSRSSNLFGTHGVELCGTMFGLPIYRHRLFECSFSLAAGSHATHRHRCARNGYLPGPGEYMTISGGKHSRAWREAAIQAMGVEWMKTVSEVCEAIPPAYTEHIGRYLMEWIKGKDRAVKWDGMSDDVPADQEGLPI